LKCDGTRPENRCRLSAKRASPFKSAGASVQSTTGSRGVRISGSNAGYTMFRGSVKSTGYPLYSPVSPSLPLPCVTVCHHISTGLYLCSPSGPSLHFTRLNDVHRTWSYLEFVEVEHYSASTSLSYISLLLRILLFLFVTTATANKYAHFIRTVSFSQFSTPYLCVIRGDVCIAWGPFGRSVFDVIIKKATQKPATMKSFLFCAETFQNEVLTAASNLFWLSVHIPDLALMSTPRRVLGPTIAYRRFLAWV